MIQDQFSVTNLIVILLLFVIVFAVLITIMKLSDKAIFWFKTRNALPFIPTEEYKVGQILRHFNVYLEVTASSGSCKNCYFNTGKGCKTHDKCADYSRPENNDQIIYKRIYK